ncbi:hypothetical protein K488DRAFT_65484 [Vararia minispora EC-137]|uniref:Uncharacterized protein n=1 Tax=Vararia minispora EC-137 TaxID=1314806 RepID=A0ACB8Q4R5_9AGAM|nr:hypothetical protein K488DRAFT_65484 [Vararia minispora EC-137]
MVVGERYSVELSSKVGEARSSNCQSIRLSPEHDVPLWVERLFVEFRTSIPQLRRLQEAEAWLLNVQRSSKNKAAQSLADSCLERLHLLPWRAAVPGFSDAVSLTTHHLATFLTNHWVVDEMMNAGLEWIVRKLSCPSKEGARNHQDAAIANSYFLDGLRTAQAQSSSAYVRRRQSSFDERIASGKVRYLEIPVNIDNRHWAGIRVDVVEEHAWLRDGINRSAKPDPSHLSLIDWYLSSLLRKTVKLAPIPPKTRTPRQNDGHSCGVLYLTSLANEYFGYDPWSPETAVLARMNWFCRTSSWYHWDRLFDVSRALLSCVLVV